MLPPTRSPTVSPTSNLLPFPTLVDPVCLVVRDTFRTNHDVQGTALVGTLEGNAVVGTRLDRAAFAGSTTVFIDKIERGAVLHVQAGDLQTCSASGGRFTLNMNSGGDALFANDLPDVCGPGAGPTPVEEAWSAAHAASHEYAACQGEEMVLERSGWHCANQDPNVVVFNDFLGEPNDMGTAVLSIPHFGDVFDSRCARSRLVIDPADLDARGIERVLINVGGGRGQRLRIRGGLNWDNRNVEGLWDRIIWNFFEATDDVDFGGTGWLGQLYCPSCRVQMRTSIRGGVYARAIDAGAALELPCLSVLGERLCEPEASARGGDGSGGSLRAAAHER
mmetsp:Transcript_13940/g.47055  ORF Transcript_13940/g.47055 Transcript_13940/m.47055 type:complete len:335 (-) Transcript_13940:149-1153(-)